MKTKITKIIDILLKIICTFSYPCLTFILSERGTKKEILIGMIIAFIFGVIINFKLFKNIFKKINIKNSLSSLVFSLLAVKIIFKYTIKMPAYFNSIISVHLKLNLHYTITTYLLVLLILPALVEITYILIEKLTPIIKEILTKMSKRDKILLLVITIIGFIASLILYNKTTIFYNAHNEKTPILYDVIYSTDSAAIYNHDAYLNINMEENDIRQPFFAIFALPFALVAYVLKTIFSFIPNAYAVFLNTIQISLLAFTVYMITKILNLNKKDSILYFIFTYVTFGLILYSFVMEQYIFALFYLILTIYIYTFDLLETNYFYISSVGTLLTSGIIFPLISKFKSLKTWTKNVLKCFIAFIFTSVVSGQLHLIINSKDGIITLLRFGGKNIPFINRLKQFLYFVRSIFLAPSGIIIKGPSQISYRLPQIETISIIGIIILVLVLISFILNRKNKMAIISFCWVIFSFVILCLVGWGTLENGLILYTLYFSWAYIILIYLLIDKLIKNARLKYIIIITLSLILLYFNLKEFINIIKFGLTYYKI